MVVVLPDLRLRMLSRYDCRLTSTGQCSIRLQKADIDYVLLERRDTLTPQVGASIGILPNGCRVRPGLHRS